MPKKRSKRKRLKVGDRVHVTVPVKLISSDSKCKMWTVEISGVRFGVYQDEIRLTSRERGNR